jgi:hypothetical protein
MIAPYIVQGSSVDYDMSIILPTWPANVWKYYSRLDISTELPRSSF